MTKGLIELLNVLGMITTIIAALMVCSDIKRSVTGYGFVVFAIACLIWIIAAEAEDKTSLMIQNLVLLGINCVGVYRYLIRKRPG